MRTVCLDTYAHVMAEERDGGHMIAETQIAAARESLATRDAAGEQLTFEDIA